MRSPRPRSLRPRRATTPVTVVTSCDVVLRESAIADLLCDQPDVVVVRHTLGPRRDDGLRRTVLDAAGVVEDVRVDLEHSCLGCALREDVLPAVVAAAASGRWSRVVVALPVTAEPVPAVQALTAGEVDGRPVSVSVHVDGVLAVVHGPALEGDLFGDDLWVERSQGLDEADARSVGEVLARQLEEADAVLVGGEAPPAARAAARHLAGPRVDLLALHESPGARVLQPRPVPPPRAVPAAAGCWTCSTRARSTSTACGRSCSTPRCRCTPGGCWSASRSSGAARCAPAGPSGCPPAPARPAPGTAAAGS
ncbi:GTP-binding protein [uncultured Pseudokineococcus sp.]|uniref:GTP-binding protein n=1 Tax=uncultured Pseudokineococcus sp. TaxID=1642928 RepID=UPI00261A0299|nr:GTP-binding protein [uncultured Pseudokineococcus sp.]